jgi:hypothetical protein
VVRLLASELQGWLALLLRPLQVQLLALRLLLLLPSRHHIPVG